MLRDGQFWGQDKVMLSGAQFEGPGKVVSSSVWKMAVLMLTASWERTGLRKAAKAAFDWTRTVSSEPIR